METIRIDDNRIKIMLTREERVRYGVDDRPAKTEGEARRAIRRFLAEAGREIGFEIGRGDLSVQLYESRSGGCELFVTRLGGDKVGQAVVTVRLPDVTALAGLCRMLDRRGRLAAGRRYYDDGWYFQTAPGEETSAVCEFGTPISEEAASRVREYASVTLTGEALVVLTRAEKGPETDPAPIP